jgi:hypothetical protein
MMTPMKHWHNVSVINPEHVIVEPGKKPKRYIVPLLDFRSGVSFTKHVICERIDDHDNCPVLVTGDPGVGKSTLISEIALDIDPSFDVEKVAFTLEEFERIFKSNSMGRGLEGFYPQVDADESAHAMYGDDWLKEEQRVIAKNLIISRICQQIVWYAAPRPILLNPRVRGLTTVWIHVSRPDEDLRGYAEVHIAPVRSQSKFASQKLWQPKYAFIFGRLKGAYWDRYTEKKIDFVQQAHAEHKSGGRRITKEQLERLEQLGLKTDQAKADFFGVSRPRISQIRAEIAANGT